MSLSDDDEPSFLWWMEYTHILCRVLKGTKNKSIKQWRQLTSMSEGKWEASKDFVFWHDGGRPISNRMHVASFCMHSSPFCLLLFIFTLHKTLCTPNCIFKAKVCNCCYVLECGRHFEDFCAPVCSMIWAIISLISLCTELMPRSRVCDCVCVLVCVYRKMNLIFCKWYRIVLLFISFPK